MRPVPGTLAAAAVPTALALAGGGFAAAETCTLVGANRFVEDHAFKGHAQAGGAGQQYYEGTDEVEVELHLHSELCLSKDAFAYRSQGISVDDAAVAPLAQVDLLANGAPAGHAGTGVMVAVAFLIIGMFIDAIPAIIILGTVLTR